MSSLSARPAPRPVTLGVIFGNRDFFPDHLISEAQADLQAIADWEGVRLIALDAATTKLGGVETHLEAQACAALFRKHRDEIDGILVCLPNFGDEQGIADAIRLADIRVPILVQAYPDTLDKLKPETRRDAFCGKVSVCNNLVQRGIPFSLTSRHTVHPKEASFIADLRKFVAVCRTVNGIRKVRIGAVGARPSAFNTVRYSEKLLDRAGITVVTVDFSEILGAAEKLGESDAIVQERLTAMGGYLPSSSVPKDKFLQMARLDVALRRWMDANAIDATAVQCWTSVQKNWGCNVCTSMSMMSDALMPSACEVDVTGVLTMYACQLAGQTPSALVDWNNNYGDDPDKCVLFHCGNWAKSFLPEGKISNAPILGSTLGIENTYGALDGRAPASPLTYARVTTADTDGRIRAYVGEGQLTDDALDTFGNRAVAKVPKLQALMHHICRNGFEHHAVMSAASTAAVLHEAFTTYLGWETYWHQ